MYARVTQFEIDTVAISIERGVARFNELILPEVRKQPGFAGVCLMHNPEGRGILISFWANEEAAEAGLRSGFYAEQISKFVTFYRQPPGREHFEVALLDVAALATTPGGGPQ
jgi:heme-degrading monooxygenase HmoA